MPGNWQHSSTLVEMQLLAGVQDSRKAPHFCTLARCGGRAHSREDDEPEKNSMPPWPYYSLQPVRNLYSDAARLAPCAKELFLCCCGSWLQFGLARSWDRHLQKTHGGPAPPNCAIAEAA